MTGRNCADVFGMLCRIRLFEEAVDEAVKRGEILGTTHLCIGQEAVAVGACRALKKGDYVVSNHRGHGHFLAKGGEPRRMMAELFGKSEGYCKGKGGTQHMACLKIGFLGTNGITGGGIPIATGAALASHLKGDGGVTLCFFGDGAANQGTFHESLNFAALMKLPVVYVCENNLYAMSTPVAECASVPELAQRAHSYGMEGVTVDGMDVLAVLDEVRKAVKKARDGEGPTLIEAKTYRFLGHSKSDQRAYRTKDEERHWMSRDPLETFANYCMSSGSLDRSGLDAEKAAVKAEVDEAVEYARKGGFPGRGELAADV